MGTVVSLSSSEKISSSNLYVVERTFQDMDEMFSPYKRDSLVSLLNSSGEDISAIDSPIFQSVVLLASKFYNATEGFFDVWSPQHVFDPSGIVKSYAMSKAEQKLNNFGLESWCLNVGGDIVIGGSNSALCWNVGVADPLNRNNLLSSVSLHESMNAIATSGFSERGLHIWNNKGSKSDVIQATVVSENIILADVLATSLIAGGNQLLEHFVSNHVFEALLVKQDGSLSVTAGFTSLIPA